ncbi:MAG: type 4a pilus biogenesis protein PilO [Selenomonas sp.]|uniref:type 4a pilus biogenesis protein PilO n=1 Tax=Selenomonas sp. TaxID=2053611 RepID=UPI0025D784EA|nr:type 4a pilus biogenesis protein PilO [Selenomonas sp.]MCR5757666.1 type 4a pilus biogenesis protein PilO [Selenomonas sp.]
MMVLNLRKLPTIPSDICPVLGMGSLGVLLGGILFYFFLHMPLMAAAEDCRQQAAEAGRQVTQIVNFQNAHRDLPAYQAEIAQREKRAWGHLPATLEQGEFILAIERLAGQSRMQLELVSPQKELAMPDTLCLPIKIGLTGDYFGLLRFLRGLQDGERLVVVKDMSVAVKGAGLTVDMLLNIYAVPEK